MGALLAPSLDVGDGFVLGVEGMLFEVGMIGVGDPDVVPFVDIAAGRVVGLDPFGPVDTGLEEDEVSAVGHFLVA